MSYSCLTNQTAEQHQIMHRWVTICPLRQVVRSLWCGVLNVLCVWSSTIHLVKLAWFALHQKYTSKVLLMLLHVHSCDVHVQHKYVYVFFDFQVITCMLHIKYKQLNASGGGLIVYATWSLTFQTCCVCCTGTIQGNGASAIGSFQNSDAYSIVSTNEGDHISVNVNDNACVGNYYVSHPP